MKKKLEMKNDGHDLERFDELFKAIVKVPKPEIDRREKESKKERDKKRKA